MRYAAMEEYKIEELEQLTYLELENMYKADKVIGNVNQAIVTSYSVNVPVVSSFSAVVEV